ncbi:Isoprenylcysteine carboxylmethyltransferase family protein [Desulfarculales bacterium]
MLRPRFKKEGLTAHGQPRQSGRVSPASKKLLRVALLVGVGPAAALPSALLGVLVWGLDQRLGLPPLSEQHKLLTDLGQLWMGLGLGLVLWSLLSVRLGDLGRHLCTTGVYQYLRHPQYAAFVWFLAPGLALAMNSYMMLAWATLQLPLWRNLCLREELLLEASFGQAYREYAARTGGFWPRLGGNKPDA